MPTQYINYDYDEGDEENNEYSGNDSDNNLKNIMSTQQPGDQNSYNTEKDEPVITFKAKGPQNSVSIFVFNCRERIE